ncbi:hypothetical protein CPB85DRAFT_1441947 [Mucidula mucida]|nr:hypothetical protein CPB85DRAFT_1441947 [Mucidula mucida]
MAATSNAQLAQLLSESYQQIDRLTESLAAEKHRTEHYQRIAGSSLQNGHGDLLERVRVAEERAYIAERHRDEEIAQRETITRLWHQLRDYLALLDAHSSNARKEMDHMIDMKPPPQNLRTVPVDVFPQRRNGGLARSMRGIIRGLGLIRGFDIYYFSRFRSGEPTKIYPAVNELGQRTCRNCGNAGRYKDDKCVEKWGPGPMGPGTVCDRCRKKIKRFERRGTLVSVDPVPQLARNNLPQAAPKRQDTLIVPLSPPQSIVQRASPLEEDAEADAEGDGDAEAEPEDVDELDGDGVEDAMAEDDDLLDAVDASESVQ